MKSLKMLFFATLLSVGTAGLTGCTSAQKGAAGGGLAGGIIGAVTGNNWGMTSTGPATGAAVGATTGVAVGGLAGDAYDLVTASDVERELENLRAELEAKEAELAALRGAAPDPEALAELADARNRIAELEGRLANAEALADSEAAGRAETERELADLLAEVNQLRAELGQREEQNEILQAEVDRLHEEIEALQNLIEEREDLLASLEREIGEKQDTLADLRGEVDVLRASLTGKESAMEGLQKELEDLNVRLDETSRGLTLTIVDSLLFEPGEAVLTADGRQLISDIAAILNERFPGREFTVEGHTDNQPIVHSGWNSNWELGAARALMILHELVDFHNISPDNLNATSFGEFRPATSNDTAEGRRQNRRAVIVIQPEELPVQRQTLASAE